MVASTSTSQPRSFPPSLPHARTRPRALSHRQTELGQINVDSYINIGHCGLYGPLPVGD